MEINRYNFGTAGDTKRCVIDPSFESIQMAERARKIALMAGVQTYFIVNKVEKGLYEQMAGGVERERIIGSIPRDEKLFSQSLRGEALTAELEQIDSVCNFINDFKKPDSLWMSFWSSVDLSINVVQSTHFS